MSAAVPFVGLTGGHGRGQVDGARRAARARRRGDLQRRGRARALRERRSCATRRWRALRAARSRPAASSTAPRSPGARSRRRGARLARGAGVAAGRRAGRGLAGAGARAEPAAAGGGGRGAAAVRGRPAGRATTPRSPCSPTRRCAARARRPAATARSTSATPRQLSPGGEGARARPSWCATTAPSEELERELSAVLDKLDASMSHARARTRWRRARGWCCLSRRCWRSIVLPCDGRPRPQRRCRSPTPQIIREQARRQAPRPGADRRA